MTLRVEDDTHRTAVRQEFRDRLQTTEPAWVDAIDADGEVAWKDVKRN